jgi:hypothetical protein
VKAGRSPTSEIIIAQHHLILITTVLSTRERESNKKKNTMTTNTRIAVVPDKENVAEPSFPSTVGKQQQPMNAILKQRNTKTTPSSSNSGSNNVIKAGGVPLVIKPMSSVPAVVSNHQYASATFQGLSNNVPAAAAVYNNVAVSHPFVDNTNKNENYHDVEAETTQVDWKAESKELDEMFDDQNREKFRNVPTIAKPSQLVATLFPHQVDGISWMVNQETKKPEDAIPPFYIQKTNGRYRCTLSKYDSMHSVDCLRPQIQRSCAHSSFFPIFLFQPLIGRKTSLLLLCVEVSLPMVSTTRESTTNRTCIFPQYTCATHFPHSDLYFN